ncbi:hypothetical protein Cni_G05769 [Canna indica]|uniref:Uncharacterized protein n=1 Tax=Canna indica TaxID=4628 RepID=A0AAQ3JYB6_9LILI|nr:hypothetical protein Cni_G05769 [Canna indica]
MNVMVYPKNNRPWMLSGLYASNVADERRVLWKFLSKMEMEDIPWLIIGDFNCVCSQEDKMGGNPFKWGESINDYQKMCNSVGLIEANFKGNRFTWCNNRTGKNKILARLDKALMNWCWFNTFGYVQVFHFSRIASDHRPILLAAEHKKVIKNSTRKFIFEHYWMEHSEIDDFIKDNWVLKENDMYNMESFGRSLFSLSTKLTSWAKNNICPIEKELKSAKVELEIIDRLDESGMRREADIIKMRCLSNKMKALSKQLHLKWWSKSRSKWMEENDKNTKFFHNLAKLKKSKNAITEVKVGSSTITESFKIAKVFMDWYRELWAEETSDSMTQEWEYASKLNWKRIATEELRIFVKDSQKRRFGMQLIA